MNGLTEIEFKILNYISKQNSIRVKPLLKKFPENKYSTYEQLKSLSSKSLITNGYFTTESNGDLYHLTKKGKRVLVDYKVRKKSDRFNRFKYSFLYPLSVALITAFITAYFTARYVSKHWVLMFFLL